jgi:regulator of cell morphogenesis and NO signaling
MENVLETMNGAHKELDAMFSRLSEALKEKNPHAKRICTDFNQAILDHFNWEETVLFPLFEKRTGFSGRDMTFVLKNEHYQIKKMFLSKLETLIAGQKFSEIAVILTGLSEMLTMHRQMENDIFYPWLDAAPGGEEKENIITD